MERSLRLFILAIFVMFGFISNAFAGYTGPALKLPVQPGDSSLCTVEAGGQIAPILLDPDDDPIDHWHTDASNGYYAIDFDDRYSGDLAVAAASGTISAMVTSGCTNLGTACYVKLDHGGGYKTLYYHLAADSIPSSLYVGKAVAQGEILGTIGNTGDSYGAHLHFSISYNGDSYSSTSGLSGVEMEGIQFVDYVAGDHYTSTNDATTTCTTSTHSINLVTAEASGTSYNLNGFAAYGTGDGPDDPAYLDGTGVLQSGTGSTTGHKFWLVGNVNGDSWDDVAEITDTGGYTYAYVYTGKGDNGLNSRTSWVKTTTGVTNAFLEDFDADGDDDLILGYANSDGTAKWKKYLSATYSGSRSFGGTTGGSIWSSTFGKAADTFVIGDFDNDNKAELLDGRESSGSNDGDFDYTLTWKRLSNTGSATTVYTGYGYSGDQFIAVDFDNDDDDDLLRIDLKDSTVSVLVAKYSGSSFTTPSIRATDVGGTDGQYYFYPIDDDDYPDLLRVHDDPDDDVETSDALSMSLSGVNATTGSRIWAEQGDQSTMLDGMSPDIDYLFGYFGDYDVTTCE